MLYWKGKQITYFFDSNFNSIKLITQITHFEVYEKNYPSLEQNASINIINEVLRSSQLRSIKIAFRKEEQTSCIISDMKF